MGWLSNLLGFGTVAAHDRSVAAGGDIRDSTFNIGNIGLDAADVSRTIAAREIENQIQTYRAQIWDAERTIRGQAAIAGDSPSTVEQLAAKVALGWTWHTWADLQAQLGMHLAMAAGLKDPIRNLGDAITAFRDALKVYSRDETSDRWAFTQLSLGTALNQQLLASRDKREHLPNLEHAIAALRAALTVWTREAEPEHWSTANSQLGLALQLLGGSQGDMKHVQEAIAIYQKVLSVPEGRSVHDIVTTNLRSAQGLLSAKTRQQSDGPAKGAVRQPSMEKKAMADPITAGALAATALALVAEATVKGSVGELVKDAYSALKNKIAAWAGSDVRALESDPASKGRQAVLAEQIDRQSPGERDAVQALATQLIHALKQDGVAVPPSVTATASHASVAAGRDMTGNTITIKDNRS
jgi:tetratricopeptide (TPR) repeat protein